MSSSFFQGDWWVRSTGSLYFQKELIKYFVQLYMSFVSDGKTYRLPSTGILVEVNKNLLWVSAGHVIEFIVENNNKGTINELRWLDRWELKGVEALPFNKRNIEYYSGGSDEEDYGAILLSILEAEHFRRNPNLKPLIMRMGRPTEPIIKPEGYELAGFPWVAATIESKPVSSKKEMVRFSSVFICLPIEKKEWIDMSSHEGKWGDEDAFYGQLMPFSDVADAQPEELRGMSGGPIFSFRRDEESLNIELEGIFDSYHRSSRQIRAEPTDRMLTNLETWLNKLHEK